MMEKSANVDYSGWLSALPDRYKCCQTRAALSVNAELLKFYWSLGHDICRMEVSQPWGSRFLTRLSDDIRREIPHAGCFSRGNLYYIRAFYKLYGGSVIVPQVEGQIVPQAEGQLTVEEFQSSYPQVTQLILSVPWGHHKVLIDKFKQDQRTILFYVRKIAENGWSRSTLEHWIASNLHLREGQAVDNFTSPAVVDHNSDLANELLKDPYDFSFLSLTERYRERELKDALVSNIEKFLLELGEGFCFKGREIDMNMGEEVRPLDMLFYHDVKRCYVVIEVKVRKFDPADVGQINGYMSAVNHQFRKPGDGPTIGLIICREKDRITAQYALEDVNKPIGIADYTLEKFLPVDFVSDLPTIEEIERDQTLRLQKLLSNQQQHMEVSPT